MNYFNELDLKRVILEETEWDPRDAYTLAGIHIVAHAIKPEVPADIRARIISEPLRNYAAKGRASIESGNYGALAQYQADLRSALTAGMAHERQFGALKPWTAGDQITGAIPLWEQNSWNGNETGFIKDMLRPPHDGMDGERILDVTFRTITTDQRTITRDEMRTFAASQRPAGMMHPSYDDAWDRNFTSEHSPVAAEERAAHVAARKRTVTSGPSWEIGKTF